MNALTEGGGSIITLGGTPATCSTPDNQVRWGCTAFYQPTINSTPPPATVVAYPYGSTAAPQVALESDYLKNVVPAEMSVSIAPQVALEAQAIVARSYAWNKQGDLNNSANRQVFVPYRFEFLRVESGDAGHNPTTTPMANLADCASITPTYQRTVCDALDSTEGKYISEHGVETPAFAEYSLDASLQTNNGGESYLQSVEDPISYDEVIPTIVASSGAHGRGMSQNGSMRWGHGNSSRSGGGDPWSVSWDEAAKILVHYYTGIDLRDGNDDVISPPLRWNILQHDIPATIDGEEGTFVTFQVQNTGTVAWANVYYGIYTTLCEINDSSCPDYDDPPSWWMHGDIWSANEEASQIVPGETVPIVYGYLWTEETGTKRLVVDVCVYEGPMLPPRAPDESLEAYKARLKKWQNRSRAESMDVDWDCFGHQSPGWYYYERQITIQ